ncbi:MAG: response regulator transcription factor [Spirochaetota bacterium]
MTVAVVDDEAGVREAVSFALEEAGYSVAVFRDGADAWSAWRETLPDLVVLDIIMPRLDGLELCRRLRARSMELPVIFLTSKDEEIDRVVGLEVGADDYLCKPFSVRELVARIRALERRLNYMRSGTVELLDPMATGESSRGATVAPPNGGLYLDPDAIRVWWNGRLVPLTVTEFRLLEVLVERSGAVLSREQLLRAAYPDDVYVTERSIDSHIRRIRKKFEETGRPLEAIASVYGAGYRYQEQPLG